jgi:ADP-heptose:LPS heptosyltransferase
VSTSESPPRRILLIQIVKLGDVLLSSALLDDLHRAAPDAAIDVLTGPAAAPLLEGHPLIRRILRYRESAAPALMLDIRRAGYDWIVDVQSSAATAPLVWPSGARVRVGWGIRAPWRWAYTHTLPRGGREAEFVVRERRRLLELFGVAVGDTRPRLYLADAEREAARQALEGLGLPNGRPLVGLSLSSSVPMKDWPVERWAETADAVAGMGAQPVVLLAPGDEAKVVTFARRTNAAVLVPPRSLREFAALVSHLDLYASSDTGPAHFAMAVGVPTVTLYTPGNARRWNPLDATTVAIEAPAIPRCPECAVEPLAKRERLVHHCVPRISVAQVMQAIREQLARRPLAVLR